MSREFDVRIYEIDNVFLKIESDAGIAKEISDKFTFEIPKAKYHPKVKARIWDGKIRLYNYKNKTLYKGLKDDLIEFCKDMEYTYLDSTEENEYIITDDEVIEFFNVLNLHTKGVKLDERYYQLYAIYLILNNKRQIILSSTGSGKSSIIYCVARFMTDVLGLKVLILESETHPIEQLYNDFIDYSSENGYDVEKHVHKISSGQSKDTDRDIVMSTRQSVEKMEEEWFSPFQAVIVDEVHYAKSAMFVSILEKMKNAYYRVGLTGTLDEIKIHELVLRGLLGQIDRVSKTKELIDEDVLSKVKLEVVILDHCSDITFKDYQLELKKIYISEFRNYYISSLCNKLDGNTIIIFEKTVHGALILEMLNEVVKDKNIMYMDGKIKLDKRTSIIDTLESSDNNIVLASRVFTTSINCKNIHNIVFAHPYKSVIRVLQSIGRGVRKHKSKEYLTVYDICDDLRKLYKTGKRGKENFLLEHAKKRIKYYNQEEHPYKITNLTID